MAPALKRLLQFRWGDKIQASQRAVKQMLYFLQIPPILLSNLCWKTLILDQSTCLPSQLSTTRLLSASGERTHMCMCVHVCTHRHSPYSQQIVSPIPHFIERIRAIRGNSLKFCFSNQSYSSFNSGSHAPINYSLPSLNVIISPLSADFPNST